MNGVAVECRKLVLKCFDFEIRNGGTAHIGDTHPQHQAVDEVADDNIASLHRLGCKPIVGVQRVVVHCDHAEEVVVVFSDGLTRPVAEDVTRGEIFQASAERALMCRHEWATYRPDHCLIQTQPRPFPGRRHLHEARQAQ